MLPVVGITIMFPVVGFSSHPSPYQRLLVSSMGKEKQTGLEIFGKHQRARSMGIFPYIGLIYGRYLQSIGSWNSHWLEFYSTRKNIEKSLAWCFTRTLFLKHQETMGNHGLCFSQKSPFLAPFFHQKRTSKKQRPGPKWSWADQLHPVPRAIQLGRGAMDGPAGCW